MAGRASRVDHERNKNGVVAQVPGGSGSCRSPAGAVPGFGLSGFRRPPCLLTTPGDRHRPGDPNRKGTAEKAINPQRTSEGLSLRFVQFGQSAQTAFAICREVYLHLTTVVGDGLRG